jgi:hypothetical protein
MVYIGRLVLIPKLPGPYSLGTAAAYVPIAGDVGTALTLTVKATNSFGSASATSVATGVVS